MGREVGQMMKKCGRGRWSLRNLGAVVLIMAVPVAVHIGSQILLTLMMRMVPGMSASALAAPAVMVGSLALTVMMLILLPRGMMKAQNQQLRRLGKAAATSKEGLGVMVAPTWLDVGLAPLALVLSLILATAVMAVVSLIPGVDISAKQELGLSIGMNGWQKVVVFLTVAVAVPVGEEVIFRGWIYGKLRKRVRGVVAVALSALLFAVMHGQLNVIAAVLPVGVIAALLREYTGTIWAGVLLHMLKNGLAFYILMISGMI